MMKNSLNTSIHPAMLAGYNSKLDDGESSMDSSSKYSQVQNTGELVNYISFNQDNSCVAVGLTSGYKIFNCNPTFGKCYQYVKKESVGLIEMLYTTTLIVIVGLGEELGSSPRKLKIVNCKKNSTICDLIFPSTILNVKMSRSKLIVLLETQIYIYDITNMKLLHSIETSPNVNGLCALANNDSINSTSKFLAYPSPPQTILHDSLLVNGINTNGGNNSVRNNIQSVSNTPNRVGDVIIFNTNNLQPFSVIEAHKSTLAALTLSNDGTLLATASDKGTIVRIFNVSTGVKLFQFRRGTYPTKIFSLKFSNDNKYIIATSSSGTIHIFRLGEEEALENKHRRKRQTTNKVIKEPTIHEETADGNDDNEGEDIDLDGNDEEIQDDGDDSDVDEDEDDNEEEAITSKPRKLSQGSTGSFTSINSGLSTEDIPMMNNGANSKTEPIIDQTRLSVARMIRRSSQTLGRKAAQKMGDFLPSRFSSILEPTRHFASIKINSIGKDVKSIAAISNDVQEVSVPQLYLSLGKDVTINDMDKSKDLLNLKLLHVNVITSEGLGYTYGLDPERGGDCILLNQYSLLG